MHRGRNKGVVLCAQTARRVIYLEDAVVGVQADDAALGVQDADLTEVRHATDLVLNVSKGGRKHQAVRWANDAMTRLLTLMSPLARVTISLDFSSKPSTQNLYLRNRAHWMQHRTTETRTVQCR